jgi:copper chaperone CopZ/thiol-disulfide isomerase/thioredoxin
MVEKIMPIVNMDCASCAKTIEKELKKIPGITEIKVNILMKKATVRYDPVLVDLPKIESKIEDIGYRIGYKKYWGVLDKILEALKATVKEGPRSIADHEFEDYIIRSKSLVVVEFASTSCPSCRILGRVLTNIEGKYKDEVYFYQMDINTTSHWKEFNIMSVPTLIYFRGGIEISRHSGLPGRDEIVQQIDKLI